MKKFSAEKIEKILVPYDGSDYSARAIDYAIGLAKAYHSQIMIIYVIDVVVVNQFSKSAQREIVEAELGSDGQRFINHALGLVKKEGLEATSMLVKGNPFEQIVNLAKRFDIDLIVLGTYGHRGSTRIIIGSVAERVIEYASCPVLVLK